MHTDALIVPTRVEVGLGARCTLQLRFARHHFLSISLSHSPMLASKPLNLRTKARITVFRRVARISNVQRGRLSLRSSVFRDSASEMGKMKAEDGEERKADVYTTISSSCRWWISFCKKVKEEKVLVSFSSQRRRTSIFHICYSYLILLISRNEDELRKS